MTAEQPPPGDELPLFIDPAGATNPVEHIKFSPLSRPHQAESKTPHIDILNQLWYATPRRNSRLGNFTIEVVDLNRMELLELRSDYFRRTIYPIAVELLDALDEGVEWKVVDRMNRALKLICRGLPFTALSFDALSLMVASARLAPFDLTWPAERDVGKL